MSEPNKDQEVKPYAGGWIMERKGTDAPVFLKFAFPVIGFFCVAYFIVYMNGETSHADRGSIVQAFNKATTTADPLMYGVAALALIYVLIVVAFAFKAFKED